MEKTIEEMKKEISKKCKKYGERRNTRYWYRN